MRARSDATDAGKRRTELTAAAFDARLARAGLVLAPDERAAVLELARRLHRAATLVRTSDVGLLAETSVTAGADPFAGSRRGTFRHASRRLVR